MVLSDDILAYKNVVIDAPTRHTIYGKNDQLGDEAQINGKKKSKDLPFFTIQTDPVESLLSLYRDG